MRIRWDRYRNKKPRANSLSSSPNVPLTSLLSGVRHIQNDFDEFLATPQKYITRNLLILMVSYHQLVKLLW